MKWLTENDVIRAVKSYLEEEGWRIINECNTSQRGIDIEAIRKNKKLAVEAKGGTSSKKGTRRYDKEFSGGQKGAHIAYAILASLKQISKGGYSVAMAFPDDKRHLYVLEQVRPALKKLHIAVYVVDMKKRVRVLENSRSWVS